MSIISSQKHVQLQNRRITRSLWIWLNHKEANPWLLTCVTFALSEMSRNDWYNTSVDTNIAESAHAQSQRDGVKLTLVTAVKKGQRLDSAFFGLQQASGICAKYGNMSMTGRARQNLICTQSRRKKKQGKEKVDSESAVEMLRATNELAQRGVGIDTLEPIIASHS